MKTKNQKLIAKLKSSAVKLRLNYQIPLKLAVFINRVDDHTSESELKFLQGLCMHYIRIENYYKIYKDIDKTYSLDIETSYQQFKEGQIK